mgnify:CR=1 FL=1
MKAGFLYIVQDDDPHFASSYISDGGILIMSRFPIVSMSHHPFTYSQEMDGLVRRGCIYAKIEVKGSNHVHLFTSHMCSTHLSPADRAPEITAEALKARANQIEEMAEFAQEVMAETCSPSDLVLITGDFNVLRYPYPESFHSKILGTNPEGFEPIL